jgi:hypothetical protein
VKKCFFLALISLQLLFSTRAAATHLRAADIQVERVCGTLTFRITVIAYLNSSSNTRFGTNSEVIFGDGTSVRIPLTTAVLRPDLGSNISVATFTTEHTYATNGVYTIAYIERDRSAGVLNIANSTDVPYVTFVRVNTDPTFGCNRYPVLTVVPLDRACSGAAFYHNSGAFDADGDSISYQMSVPSASPTSFAVYDEPNAAKFYPNVNIGNEDRNGKPTFAINALTGLVTWNAPGAIGEYNIAFKIVEWRKRNGTYVEVSSTTRDMQIVVETCSNKRPNLLLPNELCVLAGTSIDEVIRGTDPENHPVKIELFSELLQAPDSLATIDPKSVNFVSSSPHASVRFRWKTECSDIRQQPYQVVVKITDSPPDGPKLVSFATWTIRVIAPPPLVQQAELDVVKLHGVLEWNPYSCPQAEAILIYRKVGSYPFTPGICQTGIPAFLGYQLIDTVGLPFTTYRDTNFGLGLSPGATYCYRLVALIKDTRSIVSDEFCIGPVKTDAPVITHVSVERTAESGSIRVSWRSPLDIDEIQFPKPYEYEIYRSNGFVSESVPVNVGRVSDTTFLDDNVDSKSEVFNYRIVLYSKPKFSNGYLPIDTSAAASTVRLAAERRKGEIELHWRDSVPWSNVVLQKPYHLIYRAEGLNAENRMMLIDSTEVTRQGLRYHDRKVKGNQLYSYKIVTRGTYGNPEISIQENFSQVVIVPPPQDLSPCPPIVTINVTDCDQELAQDHCNKNVFENVLFWEPVSTDDCRLDVIGYNVYAASTPDGEFKLVSTVAENNFVHKGIQSYAYCYRVAAVDSEGNESAMSESVCNDNCPSFELPNVFTPNGDGCNDAFSSGYDPLSTGENAPCELHDLRLCSRFVEQVQITIYNRWGKPMYSGTTQANVATTLLWDGKDTSGNACASGIYYYSAEVRFNTIDVSKRHKRFKGWVHLLR